MTDLLTLTTDPAFLARETRISGIKLEHPTYQIRPADQLPILIQDPSISWSTARWGMQFRNVRLTQVPVERIMSKKPFNILIRKSRIAVPVNCFFSVKDDRVWLVRVLKQRTVFLGGICHTAKDDGLSFSILTCRAADILQRVCERMPVMFGLHSGRKWLEVQSVMDVMRFADRSGDHWFDYFEVSSNILRGGVNDRALLQPLGMSRQQWFDRDETLRSLKIKEDRINRGNSKGRR